MKENNNSEKLFFEEVEEDTLLENSAGCKTNGRSTCCTTYCTDHGTTCKVMKDPWGKFLEENGGVIQY